MLQCNTMHIHAIHELPAPRKPTPEGIAAVTREASHPIVEDLNAPMDDKVNEHDPSDTNPIYLIILLK